MSNDVTQILENLALRQPAAPALHAPGRKTLTYADLGAQIRYVRERLSAWGVARGDVIVGVIPTRPEMAVACAAMPAAATFAPLSPTLTADEYVELLMRLRPKALLVSKGLQHPVRAVARQCGVAEIDLIGDPGGLAGTLTLDLQREDESLARESSARPEWASVVCTSGTTGRPKLVPMSHRRLASYAQILGDRLQLAANDVGVHIHPMHHGAGSDSAVLVPLLRGSSIVCLPESDIDGFFAALDEYQLTWFTAGFTHLREMVRRAPEFRGVLARSRLRIIRVQSGRLEPDEVDRMEAMFGAPLLIGFGMTEAHQITADPLPPRKRKRGSVGVPLASEVAIMNGAGSLCAAGEAGEIVVRGPLVFDGYFDDAQATAAAFVDGWFRTGDLGRFDEDGFLHLVGRLKELINRGGEKIAPMEIDATIGAIPGVREAATFAVPHPTLGEEVATAVVPDGSASLDEERLIAHVVERLGPKRAPRRIYFVDQLPHNDNGKVPRTELPRLLGLDEPHATASEASAAKAPAPALSPLEAALVGLWSSVLDGRNVGTRDDFFLLGGDSLRGARLLTSVKAVFGIDIPIQTLFGKAATIAGMARAIEQARSASATSGHG